MGKGLSFLDGKYWHPGRKQNVQKKWEKKLEADQLIKKKNQHNIQLKYEREILKNKFRIIHAGGRESEYYRQEIKRASVNWMYHDPPGMKDVEKKKQQKQKSRNCEDVFQKEIQELKKEDKRKVELEYESTLDSREIQLRRFKFLQNAPLEGKYVSDLKHNLKHKPFGKIIKDVKCLKCSIWGHRIGDAECPYTYINPFNPHRILEQDYKLNLELNIKNKGKFLYKKRKMDHLKQFDKVHGEFLNNHNICDIQKIKFTKLHQKEINKTLKQSLEKLDKMLKTLKK